KELEDAITSVFEQSFQDFEILLVDNVATEGTRKVAEQWQRNKPDQIRIVSEPRKGAASARNKGIQESLGEFIALLDSDDLMKPDRLKIQLHHMCEHRDISLLGSWKDEISSDGKTLLNSDVKPEIPRWGKLLFAKRTRFLQDPLSEPQTSTFFFRKSTAIKIGMFDTRFDPFWLEDSDFVLRMYEAGKVSIVPQSLIFYRTHSKEDAEKRIFDFRLIENHALFFTVLKDRYKNSENGDLRRPLRKLESRWLRESGIKLLYFQKGRNVGGILLRRALKQDFFDIRNWETLILSMLPKPFYPKPFGVFPRNTYYLPECADEMWAQHLFK
ncbi:MAG: glycosyltransferase family A protein, partial [Leptospirales bacterium]